MSEPDFLELYVMLAKARQHLDSITPVNESMNESLDRLIGCDQIERRIVEMSEGPEAIAGLRMTTGEHAVIDQIITIALVNLQRSLLLRMCEKNIQGLEDRIDAADSSQPGLPRQLRSLYSAATWLGSRVMDPIHLGREQGSAEPSLPSTRARRPKGQRALCVVIFRGQLEH